mmetsp:Transcript_24973/g.72250  ORF Transcript_24973/g.72250 Transcript_24973/m.72250 type:complete len:147 (-) Transcript_24973:84-524(-)
MLCFFSLQEYNKSEKGFHDPNALWPCPACQSGALSQFISNYNKKSDRPDLPMLPTKPNSDRIDHSSVVWSSMNLGIDNTTRLNMIRTLHGHYKRNLHPDCYALASYEAHIRNFPGVLKEKITSDKVSSKYLALKGFYLIAKERCPE